MKVDIDLPEDLERTIQILADHFGHTYEEEAVLLLVRGLINATEPDAIP